MRDFVLRENACETVFRNLGECYHLWTPENFEIVFTNDDDFKVGMSVIGISAKLYPDVSIITFEIMNNHLHIAASGILNRILAFFETIRDMLKKHFKCEGRTINWENFNVRYRLLGTLSDIRNVIVYDNRNGYVVYPDETPFSYRWGANRYYFNRDACRLASADAQVMHIREIRRISHSHYADGVKGLLKFEGHALPLSFCDIRAGENLFRNASHYFSMISKNIESNAAIAKEIGESIYYTDDDLFDVISRISRQKYNEPLPSRLKAQNKIEIAKTMRYEYNASQKQIQRMLKVGDEITSALFKRRF